MYTLICVCDMLRFQFAVSLFFLQSIQKKIRQNDEEHDAFMKHNCKYLKSNAWLVRLCIGIYVHWEDECIVDVSTQIL